VNPLSHSVTLAETGSGRILRMSAIRKVDFSVVHPVRPVFDLRESTLADLAGSRPVLLLADSNVTELYGRAWRRYAERRLNFRGELSLSLSEHSKAWPQVDAICAHAARCGFPRNGLMVAIGGGVTLDTVGFAASVFRRGIGYVRIPTTLVGLADVAVGIKQAVNAHGKKNLIGAFHPPVASINDYRFLRTLPASEIACGMAEIVKMALLRDASLFSALEKHGRELVFSRFRSPAKTAENVALRSELLMMQELAPNLFERQHARLVDFGHTFSPVIETLSDYQVQHGQAVALDMLLSLSIAVQRRLANISLFGRLRALLFQLGLPVWHETVANTDALVRAIEEAKRHRGGSLNLVTITHPGRPVFLSEVSKSELDSAGEMLRAEIPISDVSSCSDFQNYARAAV